MALALVRDLREHRVPAGAEELAGFETGVLAGFVLARASAGLADSTIRSDTGHLELIRDWFGRPLGEMRPADADAYFGRVLRDARPSTRTGRAAALTVYFQFLELRHKIEIYNLTGRVAECPLDEMNRPRASVDPQLRVPPAKAEIEQLFAGWRGELATCRKFAPAARNYAAARLEADVGLRVNEACLLDLEDVRWELGRFGKLNVRHGKGSRRRGPKPRLVPLINGADRNLRHGISIERIRRDRVLHEALTARADPLHLALVFGLSHTTASKYTLIACDLLGGQSAGVTGEQLRGCDPRRSGAAV